MIKVLFIGNDVFGYDVLQSFKKTFEKYQWFWIYKKKDKYIKNLLKTFQINKFLKLYPIESILELEKIIQNIHPDIILTASCGYKLSKKILNIPKLGGYNFHPSWLPKLRGPSPIRSAILLDYKKTGLTIYKMNQLIDAGLICLQKEVSIKKDIYYQDLYTLIVNLVRKSSLEFLEQLLNNNLIFKSQDNKKATYCKKIKTQDGYLDFFKPLKFNLKKIQAFHNNIGASILFDNNRYLIRKAITCNIKKNDNEYDDIKRMKIGQMVFLKRRIIVKLLDGLLEILSLQKEGKNPLPSFSFINGWKGLKIINTFSCLK